MTVDKQQTESNKTAGNQDAQPSLARRRFLKGTSLAMPAVMTLHVQSVAAQAADTFYRCTQNLSGEFFLGVIETEDGCAREVVDCFVETGGTQAVFVDTSPESEADWVVRTIPDGTPTTIEPVDLQGAGYEPCDPPQMYALIRYDETDGSITNLGVSGDGADSMVGIAMSAGGACWNSLVGVTGW